MNHRFRVIITCYKVTKLYHLYMYIEIDLHSYFIYFIVKLNDIDITNLQLAEVLLLVEAHTVCVDEVEEGQLHKQNNKVSVV